MNIITDMLELNKTMKVEQAVDTSGLTPIDNRKGFIIEPPPIPKAPEAIPAKSVTKPILIDL